MSPSGSLSTLEELARFKESCDRLAVLMIQMIANAHQAPRLGVVGRERRSAPSRETNLSLADYGQNMATTVPVPAWPGFGA